MSQRRNKQIFVAILILLPALCIAQEQRPALIPPAQGSGGGNLPSGAAITGSYGSLSDGPITPGEIVHINVFNAPDLSITTRLSESGDVPYPILGAVHLGGLTSISAAEFLTKELKDHNILVNPDITVTVDSTATGITVLGEVRLPGIYPMPGKHLVSDILAAAGGLTANTGRVIEISNERAPGQTTFLSWDPTMHNTDNFDRPVSPGDRVLVRACGIAYVGGNVMKAGAYSLCGSPKMTLSEVVALAGGVAPLSSTNHTYLVRAQPDGTRLVEQIDIKKVLTSRVSDPLVQEDDIIYVSPSPLKAALKGALVFAMAITPSAIYAR